MKPFVIDKATTWGSIALSYMVGAGVAAVTTGAVVAAIFAYNCFFGSDSIFAGSWDAHRLLATVILALIILPLFLGFVGSFVTIWAYIPALLLGGPTLAAASLISRICPNAAAPWIFIALGLICPYAILALATGHINPKDLVSYLMFWGVYYPSDIARLSTLEFIAYGSLLAVPGATGSIAFWGMLHRPADLRS